MKAFFKRLFRIKRYFFVSFSHNKGFGSCSCYTTNGCFPQMEMLRKNQDVDDVCVLNITELSKKDFNDLYKN